MRNRRPLPHRPSLRSAIELHGYILLYDGPCPLCNRFVEWILRHDRHGTMRFASLQGDLGQDAVRQLPQLAGVDSVVLLHREGAYVRSTAVLEVARYLGGAWRFALAGYAVPRVLRDAAYDAIATRRHRLFGRQDACPVPPAGMRGRFLDQYP